MSSLHRENSFFQYNPQAILDPRRSAKYNHTVLSITALLHLTTRYNNLLINWNNNQIYYELKKICGGRWSMVFAHCSLRKFKRTAIEPIFKNKQPEAKVPEPINAPI